MKQRITYGFTVSLLLTAFLPITAQKVNISLSINDTAAATVFQNEAVLIDLAVFNKKAQADQRWNRTGEERLAEVNDLLKQGKISKEEYDKEKTSIERNKKQVQVISLGTSASSWTSAVSWKVTNTSNKTSLDIPLKLLAKPSTTGAAVLDAEGYYMACYGISPDDMQLVAPGTYSIECVINNISSGAVLLTVNKGMMPDDIATAEAALLQTGRYYWHALEGKKVQEYAEKILAKNAESLEGLSLKGDGQLLQKYYLPALETYNKAIRIYYRQNGSGSEPPDYLLSMIDLIKREIGQ